MKGFTRRSTRAVTKGSWFVRFTRGIMRLLQRVLARWRGLEAREKHYTAIFLDDSSQDRLLAWWKARVGIPLLPNLRAHHMTLKFDPSPDDIRALRLGDEGLVQAIGYAADERGQAVLVRSSVRSSNTYPHVTIAVANGVNAVYSNELLRKGVIFMQGPTLTGTIGVDT